VDKAKAAYAKVIKDYPNSGAADKARTRLDMMK
jgi:TolA-binding protein